MNKIKKISEGLSMTTEQANDVCDLFDKLVKGEHMIAQNIVLNSADDYIEYWRNWWFRSMNYEQLVQSEVDQGGFGGFGGFEGDKSTWRKQAEEFCEAEMNNTIFLLPCGMYAQYVG